MNTLRQQYEELVIEINKQYRNLVDKVISVQYYDPTEDEDLWDCASITYITRRGHDVDAKVLGISKTKGIYIANYEDNREKFWVSLSDLSSLYDKITVVELLEVALKLRKL